MYTKYSIESIAMSMKYTLLCILIHFVGTVNSQDTISIVAVDENTGEVGSAAASCADLDDFPGYPNDMLFRSNMRILGIECRKTLSNIHSDKIYIT